MYGSAPPLAGSAHGYYNQPPPGPPPPSQYASSPAPYGGPAPGGYGAPPPASYPTPLSPGYGAPQIIQWDPNPTAAAIHKALKKLNTDEKAIISAIAHLDPLQIQSLNLAYERTFRINLARHLSEKNSSWFGQGLAAIARGPLQQDVFRLHEAMSGPGTRESIMNDVLLSRSNADINAIKAEYKRTYHRDLVAAVKDELSLKTERHFEIVLSATRAEDSAPVVRADIDRDVDTIYRATEGKIGHDAMAVCSILSLRNDNQIRAISHEYERKYAARLESVIRREFQGHMEDALVYQLQHGTDRYMLQARLLEESMAGLGTKDHQLVNRVVKCHWNKENLANVKGAYQTRYKKSLANRIHGETSGDYRRLMLACIGEPWK